MDVKRFAKFCLIASLLFMSAAVPGFLFSQVTFPSTPAGKRAAEIMELIISGTAEQAAKYVSENYTPGFRDAFPIDRHTGLFSTLRQRHPSLEAEKIVEPQPYNISLQLYSKASGHRIIGHNGGAGGVNSHLAMYMDLGYTVAIMSNYDPPAAERIADKMEELLTR